MPFSLSAATFRTAYGDSGSRSSATRRACEALPHVSVFSARTAVTGARSTDQTVFSAIGYPNRHTAKRYSTDLLGFRKMTADRGSVISPTICLLYNRNCLS